MKKILIIPFLFSILCCICGCSLDDIDNEIKEASKPNITCTTTKQYKDNYGISYYIEGTCKNNGTKDYDYLQVEFICYDKDGNNLGTAMDNTNNLLGGQTWKFKAMSLSDVKQIDHCDYHEVTGW